MDSLEQAAASNPYRPAPGSQPPFLAGRAGETSAAFAAAALTRARGAAQPIVFVGLRGMGKTALLRRCVERAEEMGAIALTAEAGDAMPLAEDFRRRGLDRAERQLQGLPAKVRSALERALEVLPMPKYDLPHQQGSVSIVPARQAVDARTLVEALDALNRAACEHDRFLLIAIDEIQEGKISELQPVVTYVHETAGTARPALLLGAGLPNAATHLHGVRTYTERWRYFEIGLLSQSETRQAILDPAVDRGVTIESPALEKLVGVTAGYPFFIQEYASAAWLVHQGSAITEGDVNSIVPGVQRTLETSYYEGRFKGLTPREVRYCLAMADMGAHPHTVREVAERLGSTVHALSSTRNQLLAKDVLFSPASGEVEFRMPLTERYIASHRESLERRARVADDLKQSSDRTKSRGRGR